MLVLLFGAISLLYATVGQAGGTSFLALMALASFPPSTMRPTALVLNIVASTYSTWLFNRGKFVAWAKLTPLLVSSVPTALVGGLIILDERHYKTVTGLALLLAGSQPAVDDVFTGHAGSSVYSAGRLYPAY
jgi:uncharacterized membrane protein YfcA